METRGFMFFFKEVQSYWLRSGGILGKRTPDLHLIPSELIMGFGLL